MHQDITMKIFQRIQSRLTEVQCCQFSISIGYTAFYNTQ